MTSREAAPAAIIQHRHDPARVVDRLFHFQPFAADAMDGLACR
jgi:hypothetical protein